MNHRAGLVVSLVVVSTVVAIGVEPASAARPAWTTSKIKGTPNPPPPHAIRSAYPNLRFDKPTSLTQLPGGRMLVSEIGGRLFTFDTKNRKTPRKDELLRITGSPKVWHATPHPKFAANGLLFVSYSKGKNSYVSRFKVAGSPPKADPKSETVVITWPAGGHNAGCLRFGNDGMLYISTGDGSGPNPPDGLTAAQDVSNLLGCVLRIDVDKQSKGRNYAVPADNPFVKLKSARPEIWAYGLRNPWKFGIDTKTGDIFAADNGWETWEMVHRIVRGGNCGWPIMEGRAILRSEVKRGPTPIRPPVKDHSHAEANSVIGGPVYRGSKLKDLDGTFIYGDYITGTIWGLKRDGSTYSHRTLVDTDQRITAFAQTTAGDLLVLDYDYTGQIYELVPSGLKDNSANFPRRLSETGLFRSLDTMRPQPGVVPYKVVAERWLDGAESQRWVAVPGTGSITLAQGKTKAKYPEGTVLVKHLTLPTTGDKRMPIETQLLHFENGTWHPYTYAWNAEPGQPVDAELVETRGADRQLSFKSGRSSKPVTRNWHFGAENECRMCHNAGSGFVLGFVQNQLDRKSRGGRNQLDDFTMRQLLARRPKLSNNDPARLVNPHDRRHSLNDRARSYLHANCSSCHHPGGNAIVSFYLRRELPFDKLNTNKGTGIGTFGMKHAKLIVPGDPYRSILLYRMAKLGYGRMPYIGSRAVDSKGVALIEAWIRAMPHEDNRNDSAVVQKGSVASRAILQLKAGKRPIKAGESGPLKMMLKSTAGSLAVVVGLHDRAIRLFDVQPVYRKSPSDIAGLFEHFVPEDVRKKRLGRNIDPQTILKLKGDAGRGQLIFSSDVARCRNCHQTKDESKSVGPTLLAIRKKYKRRSEMLQHILKPSLKVEDKFATWVAVTKAGKIYNGLLIKQTNTDVTLRTAERKTVRLAKSEIEILKKGKKSLMPEGILSDLSPQEAADLLAWFSGV